MAKQTLNSTNGLLRLNFSNFIMKIFISIAINFANSTKTISNFLELVGITWILFVTLFFYKAIIQ